MDREREMSLRSSLIKAINEWWEEESSCAEVPLVGNDVLYSMSEVALQVLLAVDSTQNYLASEGMLKND